METIRLMVALASQREWSIYYLDMKFAFLHGELNENVFVEQLCGHVQKGNEQKVYKLEKLTDITTKPLKLNTFVKLRGQLEVCYETNVN